MTRAPQAGGRSIRRRLTVSLAGLAALAAAVGVVGTVGVGTLRGTVGELAGSSMPTLAAAASLAREARGIAASAPGLAAADSRWTLRAAAAAFDDRLDVLDRRMADLRRHLPDSPLLRRAAETRDAMIATADIFREAARRRIDLRRQRDRARTALYDMGAPETGEQAAPAVRRAFLAAWTRAVTRLAAVAVADSPVVLKPRAAAARQALATLQDAAAPLPADGPAAGAAARLHSLALDRNGLVPRQDRYLAARVRVEKLLHDQRRQAEHLTFTVAELERGVRQRVRETAARTDSRARGLFGVTAGLVLLGLALAATIALTLGRTIAVRLEHLRDAMQGIVEGGPETTGSAPLDDRGRDEIGDMAHALRLFVDRLADQDAALRRSNTELESFAYAVSHDLQAPLRLVRSYSELLERRCGRELTDEGQEFLHYITQGTGRMQSMIQALLEYARVQTGEPDFRPIDATAAAEGALAVLRPGLEESGGRIHLDSLPTVRAEPAQLERVFQNLVGNALKYRHADRRLEIHITAARADQPGWWRLSVGDNGIGIRDTDQERIFQVFQRLHRDDRGTGIGLSLVQRIVERHGGRLAVESAPGEGSTFHFTLPDGSPPQEAA